MQFTNTKRNERKKQRIWLERWTWLIYLLSSLCLPTLIIVLYKTVFFICMVGVYFKKCWALFYKMTTETAINYKSYHNEFALQAQAHEKLWGFWIDWSWRLFNYRVYLQTTLHSKKKETAQTRKFCCRVVLWSVRAWSLIFAFTVFDLNYKHTEIHWSKRRR